MPGDLLKKQYSPQHILDFSETVGISQDLLEWLRVNLNLAALPNYSKSLLQHFIVYLFGLIWAHRPVGLWELKEACLPIVRGFQYVQ